MASSLHFPGLYQFSPIGNTTAVCFTRDVPPDVPISILLLRCGDPRNVLYTVFCEAPNHLRRSLDFTCCDYEPGILARNVLLLTMIMDDVSAPTMWNIFFHMYLDIDSRSTLVSQSQKLESYASVEAWRSSPYGAVIKMGTDHTFAELRRHWQLYADFYHPSKQHRFRALKKLMDDTFKQEAASPPELNLTPIRSSGPLFLHSQTSRLFTEQHQRYWESGTTFVDKNILAASTHPNSTFFYSRAGGGFNVATNVNPIIPFHHAPFLGNTNRTLTIADLVESATSQFRDWCSAFRTTATRGKDGALAVRFLLGDVLAHTRALQDFREDTSVHAHRLAAPRVAPWTTCVLELNQEEYTDFGAPTRFDVIDTSNLSDHLGMLNIFLATAPLLTDSLSSVLYTASVMILASNPCIEFQATLFASLPVVAVLMDLAPVDALSGFTTRCNTHELVNTFLRSKDKDVHHQKFTWKRPSSGDPSAHPDGGSRPPVSFNTRQLAQLLYNIYNRQFGLDGPMSLLPMSSDEYMQALSRFSSQSPSRETFVVFLDFLHTRLRISTEQWSDVVHSFLGVRSQYAATFDQLCDAELHAQLHRYSLYTVPGLDQVPSPTVGRLSHWPSIPALIRVFLTVPRADFAKLESVTNRLPLPWLRCAVQQPQAGHHFQSVDAAFGTLVDTGTAATPDLSFQEDPDGLKNGASLVFSFVVPSRILTEAPAGSIFVELLVRSDPISPKVLFPVLGPSLCVFRTCLEDTKYVHLLPEEPLPLRPSLPAHTARHEGPDDPMAIGYEQPVRVDMDSTGKHVAFLTAKLEITDAALQAVFAGDIMPSVSQCSPCTIQVVLDGRTQTLAYPVPIVGSQRKLRLARKSSYIEVVVPVAIPFLQPDGLKLNPFPVVRANASFFPWNVHRVFLDQLPVVNIESTNIPQLKKWYDAHLSWQRSHRERTVAQDPARRDVLIGIKETIQSVMVHAAGTIGRGTWRGFILQLDGTLSTDTLLFVDKIRYDVAFHTVLCDGFVLPVSEEIAPHITALIGYVVMPVRVSAEELRAWKQLLPALVERCRTTWTHGADCEYVARGKVPLALEMSGGDPLCSCGRGKDVGGMLKDGFWKKFAPFVTRIALSPLFGVSYLEQILEPADWKTQAGGAAAPQVAPSPVRVHGPSNTSTGTNGTTTTPVTTLTTCSKCRKEKSKDLKLLRCSGCRTTFYCSEACQKSDWKAHKLRCKN
ncbi:hypothetical protein LXA43DRAFT_1082220 [Ganoderma leucocontextum]|nr:hypothetical protein LXA43DRAFT_1082220 [Ganoderma leucocontextum]